VTSSIEDLEPELDTTDWTDIVQVAAAYDFTVGLKSDGTVKATDENIDVAQWTDIIQLATGWGHVVGLKSDGTVVATGYNSSGQSQLCDWRLMVD
jgi:alpha-tubulin suppressor-like RCC1 family protein